MPTILRAFSKTFSAEVIVERDKSFTNPALSIPFFLVGETLAFDEFSSGVFRLLDAAELLEKNDNFVSDEPDSDNAPIAASKVLIPLFAAQKRLLVALPAGDAIDLASISCCQARFRIWLDFKGAWSMRSELDDLAICQRIGVRTLPNSS